MNERMTSVWLHTQKMQHTIVFCVTLLSCVVWCRHVTDEAEIVTPCAREPNKPNSERVPGDGGFRITVDDDPDLRQYEPERVYRVSISGSSPEHTLSSAFLVVVLYNSSDEDVPVGKFHLVDGGRLASHAACSHVVATVDSSPKAEVYVMWTAPALDSGCVEFRATVIDDEVWYKDDGGLVKVLCADDSQAQNTHTADVSSKIDCCACGTAKYQLTFQSLWTRYIHPRDFPDVNKSRLHWSPVVGSSHSKHYQMWHFNTLASMGVSDICQYGDTRALEDEIRRQSSNIRTVIKTPGIQWTTEHGLQQQRWAHFSVDRKHHLLSILSRLSPSPDWCVGVSALDLCLGNCTWLPDTTVQLFAWDAGVRHDDSYTLQNRQNYPAQPIHHLTARDNKNPGWPFRIGRPTEPVAALRLHRFDTKPDDDTTVCTNTVAKDQGITKVNHHDTEFDDPHQNSCVMGPWSQWSRCSATCGTGTRSRTRSALQMTDACLDALQTRTEPCKLANCIHRKCEVRDWLEWSPCTDGIVLCSPGDTHTGTCSRHRSRFFRHPGAEAFCNQTMEQEEPCQLSDADIIAAFDTDIMYRCFSPADGGPCNRNLLRWYYDAILSGCRTFLYGGCRGNANRFNTVQDCMQACRRDHRDIDDGVKADSGKISFTGISKTTKAVDYASSTPDLDIATPAFPIDCVMSPWSTWSDCSATCGRNGVRTRSRTIMRLPSGGGGKCPRRRLRRRRCLLPACTETSRCEYTEWSSWSPCARSCGADTVQERIQRVQGSPSRRLRCPVKLQRRLCMLPRCAEN